MIKQHTENVLPPEIDNIFCYIRLKKDLEELLQLTHPTVEGKIRLKILIGPAWIDNAYQMTFQLAPNCSILRGVTFNFDMRISKNYPFEPPRIRSIESVSHPNIDYQTGEIHLGVLKEWGPAMSLKEIIESLEQILVKPDLNQTIQTKIVKMQHDQYSSTEKERFLESTELLASKEDVISSFPRNSEAEEVKTDTMDCETVGEKDMKTHVILKEKQKTAETQNRLSNPLKRYRSDDCFLENPWIKQLKM